jgi:hypothetical protein
LGRCQTKSRTEKWLKNQFGTEKWLKNQFGTEKWLKNQFGTGKWSKNWTGIRPFKSRTEIWSKKQDEKGMD